MPGKLKKPKPKTKAPKRAKKAPKKRKPTVVDMYTYELNARESPFAQANSQEKLSSAIIAALMRPQPEPVRENYHPIAEVLEPRRRNGGRRGNRERLPDAGYASEFLGNGGDISSNSHDYNNQSLASVYPMDTDFNFEIPLSVKDKIRDIENKKATFISQYDAQLAREKAAKKPKPKLPETMINPITDNPIKTNTGYFKRLISTNRLFIKDGQLFETKKN